ncbi:cupin domain-containing protein [Candidatus Nitrosocosmicus sp. T]
MNVIRQNLYYSNEKKVNPYYFDGDVIIREIYNESNSNDQEVYFVEFARGALTTIHYHETEQFLVPLYGNGIIGEIGINKSNPLLDFTFESLTIKSLSVGEIVSIKPDILHFHGASPDQNFSHVAFRNMFEAKSVSQKNESIRTQTIWGYEMIAKALESEDQSRILNELNKISEKIRDAVSTWAKDKKA